MAASSKAVEKDERNDFDPLQAFEQEQGLPKFIPRDLLEKQMFAIECGAGEPEVKQFKITTGLLLVAVPAFMNPPLEFGDYVTAINEEVLEDKVHFYQVVKKLANKKQHQMIKFHIQRVVSSVAVQKSDPEIPSDIASQQLCDYFKNTMIFFPRSSLGINIKSVNKKVYVESTDNGFNSIARRAFYIGDALLAVNGVKCSSVKQTSNLLVDALKSKGIAQVLVERPVEPEAVAFVRAVLLVNKKNVMDPKLPDDAVLICKNELQRMKREKNLKTKSVLRKAPENKSEGEAKDAKRSKKGMFLGLIDEEEPRAILIGFDRSFMLILNPFKT